MSVDWSTTTRRHGTHSGWGLHRDLGERPCDPCYRAKQAYDARWKAAPERVKDSRLRAAAQWQASKRLHRLYPDIYAGLYWQEFERLKAAPHPRGGDVSRVIVIELGRDDEREFADILRSFGTDNLRGTTVRVAIRDDAARVLDVFAKDGIP